MELVFPFKNLIINGLFKYFEESKVKEFSDLKHGKRLSSDEYFWDAIQNWRDLLPSYENEILQLISTSDQATIDHYFQNLTERLSQIKIVLGQEYFSENISKWNSATLKKYEEEIEKEGEIFSKHKNRKMKHLEEYEEYQFSPFGIFSTVGSNSGKKVKKINYNPRSRAIASRGPAPA